jgi:glycosyltransferase involved in cell wall biosynthesis
MEAMASGRPVIATRVGGVAELVADGQSGLVVAPGDAQALADAILRLAADPALRAAMGTAGRATVHAEFDVTTEARRILALFLGQGGADPRPDPWEAA